MSEIHLEIAHFCPWNVKCTLVSDVWLLVFVNVVFFIFFLLNEIQRDRKKFHYWLPHFCLAYKLANGTRIWKKKLQVGFSEKRECSGMKYGHGLFFTCCHQRWKEDATRSVDQLKYTFTRSNGKNAAEALLVLPAENVHWQWTHLFWQICKEKPPNSQSTKLYIETISLQKLSELLFC